MMMLRPPILHVTFPAAASYETNPLQFPGTLLKVPVNWPGARQGVSLLSGAYAPVFILSRPAYFRQISLS